MTDRLREWLDPTPTDEDHKLAVLYGIRRRMTVGENIKTICDERVFIVRETMLECAKTICEYFECERCSHDYDCKAYPIHALLAQAAKEAKP